ncbi:MAG: nucleoside deaminase [Pyrinomonadaceae bacterium]|nr:nucleoside deaminase [Pyrinomonadaceae bacterium]
MNEDDKRFMLQAIELAIEGVRAGDGGPFGCVVVKDGEVIGRGNNRVTSANDPTAHAEIVAIRDACGRLGSFQLEGCTIYTSCEPCPMCLGAIYWSRPKAIFFAGTRDDAAAAGFDDALFYSEMDKPND